MAGIRIEGRSTLPEVFALLRAETRDCGWLVTDLSCYDYEGWEGCGKWAEERIFLTNRQPLHDVALRDMQFIWGIFSAVPVAYTEAEALTKELGWGGMNAFTRRNLYALLWRALYHRRPDRPVRPEKVRAAYLDLWKEKDVHG